MCPPIIKSTNYKYSCVIVQQFLLVSQKLSLLLAIIITTGKQTELHILSKVSIENITNVYLKLTGKLNKKEIVESVQIITTDNKTINSC